MPNNPTGPSGSVANDVFTRAQRQVLAYLYLHKHPITRAELSGSALLAMGGAVVQVLKSLAARGVVAETPEGWSLDPFARGLMLLGPDVVSLYEQHGLAGVRHVL
jgi:hypothetical protein